MKLFIGMKFIDSKGITVTITDVSIIHSTTYWLTNGSEIGFWESDESLRNRINNGSLRVVS